MDDESGLFSDGSYDDFDDDDVPIIRRKPGQSLVQY